MSFSPQLEAMILASAQLRSLSVLFLSSPGHGMRRVVFTQCLVRAGHAMVYTELPADPSPYVPQEDATRLTFASNCRVDLSSSDKEEATPTPREWTIEIKYEFDCLEGAPHHPEQSRKHTRWQAPVFTCKDTEKVIPQLGSRLDATLTQQ